MEPCAEVFVVALKDFCYTARRAPPPAFALKADDSRNPAFKQQQNLLKYYCPALALAKLVAPIALFAVNTGRRRRSKDTPRRANRRD